MPRCTTVGIVLESGCGKSVTSLSLMQLLQRPQGQTVGGEIRLNMGDGRAYNIVNTPTSEMMKIRGNRVSMIFQEPMTSLNPVFRCGYQIDEVINLHEPGLRRTGSGALHRDAEARRRSERRGVYSMYPQALRRHAPEGHDSHGLACSPGLIIADEPTTALDVTIQAQILDLFEGAQGQDKQLHHAHHARPWRHSQHGGLCRRHVREPRRREGHDGGHLPQPLPSLYDRPDEVEAGRRQEGGRALQHPRQRAEPVNMPDYCYFRDRCEQCVEKCQGVYPPEIRLSETHVVSCWRYDGQGGGRALAEIRERGGALEMEEIRNNAPETEGKYLIEVKNLVKWFPIKSSFFKRTIGNVRAVDGISFHIKRGQTMGLVGRVRLRKVHGRQDHTPPHEKTSGEVLFDGQDIFKMSREELRRLRPRIQIIFQDSPA